jgi:hypothetical protein
MSNEYLQAARMIVFAAQMGCFITAIILAFRKNDDGILYFLATAFLGIIYLTLGFIK